MKVIDKFVSFMKVCFENWEENNKQKEGKKNLIKDIKKNYAEYVQIEGTGGKVLLKARDNEILERIKEVITQEKQEKITKEIKESQQENVRKFIKEEEKTQRNLAGRFIINEIRDPVFKNIPKENLIEEPVVKITNMNNAIEKKPRVDKLEQPIEKSEPRESKEEVKVVKRKEASVGSRNDEEKQKKYVQNKNTKRKK